MNISKNYLFLFCCIFLLHTIDLNGQDIDWLIEPSLELERAGKFKNGLAIIRSKDGKSGVIDKTGKIIVPMIYDGIEDFKYGMARAYKDNQRMIIDSTGKVLCTLNRKETQSWSLGIEHVSEDIFLVGNLASEPRYGYGLITKHGEKLSSFDFAWGYISEFYDHGIDYKFVDGLCLMTKAKEGEEYFKFGFVDKSGKTIIPFKYDYAEHFSEGLALVAKGKIGYEMKYGFIDKTGKLVLPMIYDGVRPFKNRVVK